MRKPRQGDPKVAIAYVRVSTDKQELGPEVQRDHIAAWSRREGVSIASWHTDIDVHGDADAAARPGLAAALAELKQRNAGILAVLKRDRLARDTLVAATIDRLARDAGARVVCADGAGNGESPADVLMRQLLDSMAEFELATIRSRTKAALAVKRARGELTGMAPWGMRLGPDGRHLEPCPEERAATELARSIRARGASIRQVQRELAALGVRGRTGMPLALTQVAKLIASDTRPDTERLAYEKA